MTMNKHERIKAGLLREREARKAAHLAAVDERDALAAAAAAPDAVDYDRRALARAEARVGLALTDMAHWGDPLPASQFAQDSAPAPVAAAPAAARPILPVAQAIPESIAGRAPPSSTLLPAVDPVEAIAQRILASDSDSAVPEVALAPVVVGPGTADAIDAVVTRILQA